jgi:hypothetical protein
MRSELTDLLLSQDSFKTSWVGVMQTISEDDVKQVRLDGRNYDGKIEKYTPFLY